MRHLLRRLCVTTWLVIAASYASFGQVEIIVKVETGATQLVSQLRGAVSKVQTDDSRGYLRLLDQVIASRPVIDTPIVAAAKTAPLSDTFVLTVADSSAYRLLLSRWTTHEDVTYAIGNHRYQIDAQFVTEAEYNDTHFDSLTHLPLIRALEAWEVTRGDPSVLIGVLDTGIFKEHPDFAGQLWINEPEDLNHNGILDPGDINGIDDDGNGYIDDVQGYDFVDRVSAVDQGDYFDRDPDASEDRLSPLSPGRLGFGHGTLVAGIVSAALNNELGIAGVAPGCKLVPIRAFGIDGLGEDDDVAAAIVYAADSGIDVLNLSFGDTYYSPLMADAVRYASSLGTIIVASGGNVGRDDPHYPSDYPEVIGALWLSEDGESRGSLASFGIGIDVGAPGSFVFTTLMPHPDQGEEPADSVLYGYRSGSSVSAPQISGAAALLRSLDGDLTPASVKAILTSTAVDLGEPGWDHQTAAGRLDIAAALELPYPSSVQIQTPRHDSGLGGASVEITGSVLSSLFDSYSVWYGFEDSGQEPDWTRIVGPVSTQKRAEVLAVWNTGPVPDSTYIVRLEVILKNGRTIEDRVRVFVDRTPPVMTVIAIDAAFIGSSIGIQAEVKTDDLTDLVLHISSGGQQFVTASDRRSRRHGHTLTWTTPNNYGKQVSAWLEATNVAGLSAVTEPVTLQLPEKSNPGYLTESVISLKAGFILPKSTDLDHDGLPEIVYNQYRDGWLGDTVRVAEAAGQDFIPYIDLLANAFPRDVGDTDMDGNLEILLQVSGVTQVVEFSNNASQVELIFIDTAGIDNPTADSAAWGSLLTDLDGDGLGEIIVHNRNAWRIFEYNGTDYKEVARLENPTPIEEGQADGLLGSEANGFAEPEALAGDFDQDGLGDLLVVDTDGDFIVFEAVADNTYEAVWYHLTSRYTNRGNRLTQGDFNGNGATEFVGFTHNWQDSRPDGEYDAPYGVYYRFEAVADNEYMLLDSLIISGNISNHGSMTAIDFDSDGTDELVIAHPPDLYVVRPDPIAGWKMLAHRGDLGQTLVSGIRSIGLVTADFDLDGAPELVAVGADGRMHRFEWSSEGTLRPPAEWVSVIALDADSARLVWNRAGADSVTVYRAFPAGDFDRIATVTGDTLIDLVDQDAIYSLRSFFGSEISAMSAFRRVRPHEPARVESVRWETGLIVVTFSESLPETVDRNAVTRLTDGAHPQTALVTGGGPELTLNFAVPSTPGDTLSWPALHDVEGTPVGDKFATVPERPVVTDALYLASWSAVSTSQASLEFNLALDAADAVDIGNYRVDPVGTISRAEFDAANPMTVILTVSGRALGPTGLQTSIVVLNMTAADGTRLASEGTVATFVSAAETLADAYVFPNPYRGDQHGARIMIAGLPSRATVSIFNATGVPVRTLVERDGDGGLPWDLTDNNGEPVNSGIYLIRIEAEDESSIIIKSAIIR